MNSTLRENILFGHDWDEKRYQQTLDVCSLRPGTVFVAYCSLLFAVACVFVLPHSYQRPSLLCCLPRVAYCCFFVCALI